jgi:hypothetical protein
MAPVYGYQTQLGIDTANPVTQRFDFDSESLVCDEEFKDTNGLRGTRARSHERVRAGLRHMHGTIRFQPTTNELALLLPWILAGTPTGSAPVTYPLADLLTTRFVTIDRGAKVFTYNGCVVNRATFRGVQGEPLEVELDVLGIDETVAASGTFPVLNLDIATPPMMFYDLALVVNSVTYNCHDFTLEVDNVVDPNRFFNNQTATALIAMDRHIHVTHSLPYGDASAAYNLGVAGVAATATFTNGAHVLTFTLANVKYPRKSPHVGGREEVMLPLIGTAYKVGTSTLELVTTMTA